MGLFSVKTDAALDGLFGAPVARSQLKRRLENVYNPAGEAGSHSARQEPVVDANELSEQGSETSKKTGSEKDPEVQSEEEEFQETEDVDAVPPTSKKQRKEEDDLEDEYFRQLTEADTKAKANTKAPAKRPANKIPAPERVSGVSSSVPDSIEKNEQTVFIGNVPSVVITDKPVYAEFQALLKTCGKLVSLRFRSIAFSEMLPRKAAFIKQKLHHSRDSVNAYAVFSTKESAQAALGLNGTIFAEHHLRFDSVTAPTPHVRNRSVFVGNLDFDTSEEPLYRHFMGCGDIEYVRIVRDGRTNVGKGFGYVQFKDTPAVQAARLLDGKEFNGRKLRVSFCKSEKALTRNKDKSVPRPERTSKKPGRESSRGQKVAVLEGERAKAGDSALGRKPRHRKTRPARKANRPGKPKH